MRKHILFYSGGDNAVHLFCKQRLRGSVAGKVLMNHEKKLNRLNAVKPLLRGSTTSPNQSNLVKRSSNKINCTED